VGWHNFANLAYEQFKAAFLRHISAKSRIEVRLKYAASGGRGTGDGRRGGVERREEWRGGRQPQPASWPGTPVRAGLRAKSAGREPRFAHPTDEDLSAGTPVVHPTDEDLSAGTPVAPSRDAPISESRVGAPGR